MAKRGRAVREPAEGRKRSVARKRLPPNVDKKKEISRLKRELSEARRQLSATSEVLQIINASSGALTPIFEAVLEKAMRLCEAAIGFLTVYDGSRFNIAAQRAVPAALAAYFSAGMDQPRPGEAHWRLLGGEELVHNLDQMDEDAYRSGSPLRRAIVDLGGVRTALVVALRKNGQVLGALTIYRKEVRAFTARQIALLQNFAAQAVIAIENARLFDEVQARTSELTESLEQQTATSEVLQVISSTPGELQPVFNSMLENATRVCGAKFGTMYLSEGDIVRQVAVYNAPSSYAVALETRSFRPHPKGGLGQAIRTKQAAHILDFRLNPAYLEGNPAVVALCDRAGARTIVVVPMLRDAEVVGTIGVYRQEVRPFTVKQMKLLSNFAKQAVIAIENTRLLKELRESLQQQTATADVLKVISRSTFDLQAVLQTLVESASQLCDAEMVSVTRPRDGGKAHYHVATVGFSPEWFAAMQSWPLVPERGTLIGRTLLEGRTVHIPDVLTDPEYTAATAQQLGKFRTILGVPLLREGTAIGVFMIARSAQKPFTEKQIELVTTFADQAVIAIENARLFDEVQARTEDLRESLQQQTATADVLKVISRATFDLQAVLNTLLESAARLCDADLANIWRPTGGTGFHLAASFGIAGKNDEWLQNKSYLEQVDLEPGRGSIVGRTLLEGKTVQIQDIQADPEYELNELIRIGDYRSMLGVPLLRQGITVGVFVLTRCKVKPFTIKEVELVTTFADQAVIAIENVRLFEEVQARTRDLAESLEQQTATSEVLGAINSSREELEPLFQKILENAIRVCGAKFGTLNLYDGEKFDPVAGYNVPREYQEAQLHKPFIAHPGSALGTVVATRRPVHIGDIRAQRPYLEGHPAVVALSNLAGARTLVAVPMLKDDRLVGTIAIFRQEVSPFSEKQITLLSNFAQQAVIAIENHRLLKELRESLQQQTATADVLKVISRSTFDLQTVLQTLVESAAKLCDAEKATITRQKDGVLFRGEFYGFSDEFMDYVRNVPVVPDRGSATARSLLEGVVVHIPDVRADPDYTFNEAQRLGDFRTIIGVPMLREGKAIGVIVMTRSEVRPFTEKQIELATTFADQAAIAIENVRLFESVEARTKELAASLEGLRAAQDRLVQTEKLASLGQLTAGIAHEIKNPLNFVNNFSALSVELVDELGEVLKPAPLDEKTRQETDELAQMLKGNLEKVVQHGKRADSIVKNMLMHSREGSGDRRAVDINSLVGESLNLAYHGARAERQEFQIRLDQDLDPAAGEAELLPQEITRVLLNLISNGFYATMKRKAENVGNTYEPTLIASTKNLGNRVEIRIRDNGTGIPPEVKGKMFNPFFTTKPPGEGTGLGLSLSHDIVVKQHAGSIEVDTQPGQFSEFRVILPRKAALSKAGANS
jgi:two-component system NtrC family sensor kinase